MSSNFNKTNSTSISAKQTRQKAIQTILKKDDLYRHTDIVLELERQGIKASQSTIHRDLEHLGYKKNDEGYFELSNHAQKKYHLDALSELLLSTGSETYSHVKMFFIKTEKGNAQQISMFLEEAFKGIVLKTVIGIDNVLIFVNEDKISDEFLGLFNEEKIIT